MNAFYRMVYYCALPFFKIFHPQRVIGEENIPEGGAVICSNHTSNKDPFFILYAFTLKRPIKAMAKYEMRSWPIVGKILEKSKGIVFVKRGNSDITAIKNAIKELKNKERLLIFPEGTRGVDKMNEGKNGAAMLAARTNVPIVPIFVPAKKHWFFKTPIVIGEPYYPVVDTEKTKTEAYQIITDDLMGKIAKLEDEIR